MRDMDGYNGWSNRDTWAMGLNLSNDEVTYEECERLARRAAAGNEDDLESFHYELAQALEDYARFLVEFYPASLPDFDPEGHLSPDPRDNHGPDDIDGVNWQELAEAYVLDEYV